MLFILYRIGLGIGISFIMVYLMKNSFLNNYKETDAFTVASIIIFLFGVGIWKSTCGKNNALP